MGKKRTKVNAHEKASTSRSILVAMVNSAPIAMVEVEKIHPSRWQPRQEFDAAELESMAESIRRNGIVQPLVAREVEFGGVTVTELIAGERRLRSAKLAGCEYVPVRIINVDDAAAREMTVVENLQRKELSPIERARGFQMLLDCGDYKSNVDLAHAFGLKESTVSNLRRLLSLPLCWQDRIASGELTERQGRVLLTFNAHTMLRAAIEEAYAEENLSRTVGEMTTDVFQEWVEDCVLVHTKPMVGIGDGRIYDGDRGRQVTIFEPTPEQERELGLVEIRGRKFATNIELWEALQESHLADEDLPEPPSAAKSTPRERSTSTPSPKPASAAAIDTSGDEDLLDENDEDAGDLDDSGEARADWPPQARSEVRIRLKKDIYVGIMPVGKAGEVVAAFRDGHGNTILGEFTACPDNEGWEIAWLASDEYELLPTAGEVVDAEASIDETGDGADGKDGDDGDEPDLRDTKARVEAAAAKYAARLWDWYVGWLSYLVAKHLRDDPHYAPAIAALAIGHWGRQFDGALPQYLGRHVKPAKLKDPVTAMLRLDESETASTLSAMLAERLFWHPERGPGDVPDEDLLSLVKALSISPEVEWGDEMAGPLTKAYWELHTVEQLVAIAKEWKDPERCFDDAGKRLERPEMIRRFSIIPDSEAAILPKELKRIKPPADK